MALWAQPLSSAGLPKEGDGRRAPWRRRASTKLEDGEAAKGELRESAARNHKGMRG